MDKQALKWETVTVGDIAVSLKSGLSRKLSIKDIGLPVLRSNNLIPEGGIDYSDIKYWYIDDPQGDDTSKYVLRNGDILINFINSVSAIGKCSVYEDLLKRDVIYTTNIMRLRVDENKIIPRYFLYLTQMPNYDEYILSITKPAVNQASFTTVDFKKWSFDLPPLPEQRAIAAILGTWDEAIAAAERLVAALRERKRGLMQRLLTGQARFSGFVQSNGRRENRFFGSLPEDWPVVKLGNVLMQRKEWILLEDEKEYKRCTVKLRNAGVFHRDTVVGSKVATKKQQLAKEGDLIVAEIDAKVGGFGIVKKEADGSIVSSHYFLFEISEDIDRGFFEQCIFYGMLEKQVDATGSTNYAAVRPHDILGYLLPMPSLPEQRRIADVLATCDAEIGQHGRRLELLRQHKRGLMQQLLTGQVRVEV